MHKKQKCVSYSLCDYANVSTRALYLTLGGVVGTVMIAGTALTVTNVSADMTDNISINLEESCSMSSTGNNSHKATLMGGQYVEDIGTTTVNVHCTDTGGFAVYAVGYTALEYGNTTLRGPFESDHDGYHEINTGVFPDTSNSVWSMHLSAVEGTYTPSITSEGGYDSENPENIKYVEVPNQWTKVAYCDQVTDWPDDYSGDIAEGSSFTATYAVYANTSQPSGTYQGKVRYTLVHPGEADTPESIANSNDSGNEKTLLMQDVAEWGDLLVEGEEAYAKDSRDGNIYTVARLADGNIWMTQNLAIEISPQGAYDSDRGTYELFTSENTDLGWNGSEYDTASWIPNSSTYTDISEWQGYEYNPESYYSGMEYDIPGTYNQHYRLGNYYNWTAAIAMNDSSSVNTAEGLYPVEQSICPKGWTLPRAGIGEDTFSKMAEKYGLTSVAILDLPLLDDLLTPRFALSGKLSTNGLLDRGQNAYYWSAAYNGRDAFYGAIDGAYENNTRYIYAAGESFSSITDGYSVRCVARPVAATTEGIYH